MVIFKTILVHTKCHVTLDTFEHHYSCHAPRWRHVTLSFCVIAAWPVLIVICFQYSNVISSWGAVPTGVDGPGSLVLPHHSHQVTRGPYSKRSRNSCKVLGRNVSFPYLRNVTHLPVSNTKKFYDPNIPFHLLNARLTGQYVSKTYDNYAFRTN